MTRGVWATVAVCALGGGCNSPQYYTAPPERVPPAANVSGATVQIADQRPAWEKKPFTGPVCLYHLDKSNPGGWAQLAEEANAVVAAMPEKPQRVDVEVTSYRLVRSGNTGKVYKEVGGKTSLDPRQRFNGTRQLNDEFRQRREERNVTAAAAGAGVADKSGKDIELAFASDDDPRMLLRDHPSGASCALKAKVTMTFPNGRKQTVDVSAFSRGTNDTGTAYWGEAIDYAAKSAVGQFGEQFRTAVGIKAESQPLPPSGENPNDDLRVRPSSGP